MERLVLTCLASVLLLAGSLCSDITCPKPNKILPCRCETKSNGQNVTIMCNEGTTTQITDSLISVAEHGTAIASLRIINVNMDEVPDSFAMGTYSEAIAINNCNVTLVNERAFNTLQTQLIKLDLTSNLLPEVPRDSIKNMQNLRILFLQFNRISKIFKDDFRNLHSLVTLNLYENRITSIDSGAFDNRKLSSINFGNNEMFAVPTISLNSLPKLKELILHENKIENLKASEFENVGGSLSELDLSNNKITKIPNFTLQKMSVLNILKLEDNLISEIEIKAFVGVEDTLERLTLANNKLRKIPSKALRNLNFLTELTLNNNEIKRLEKDTFEGYGETLKYVNLQSNQISQIEQGSLNGLDNLLLLHIENNKIESLPLGVFLPILDTIEGIDVHGNPFTCDCRMIWFSSLLATNIQCNPTNVEEKKPKNYEYLPSCNDSWIQRIQKISPQKFVTNSQKTQCNKPVLGIPLSATPTESMDCSSSANRQNSNFINKKCHKYVIFVLLYLYLYNVIDSFQ